MQIKFSRNFARTELLEVGREPLRVEQGESPFAQTLDQRPERDLRRPRRAMKHRLAEKGATNRDPVKAADEFVSRPDLTRMRGAELSMISSLIQVSGRAAQPRITSLKWVSIRISIVCVRRSRFSPCGT